MVGSALGVGIVFIGAERLTSSPKKKNKKKKKRKKSGFRPSCGHVGRIWPRGKSSLAHTPKFMGENAVPPAGIR